jgi:MFS family permease
VPSAPPPTRQARRGHLIDISPLRESPAFARLWAGSAIAGIGGQMTIVAVGLHIYDITGSTFAVAMVGTLALIPMIAAGLYGGMLADAFDRRRVALASSTVAWLSTIGLVLVAWSGFEQVWPFYVLTTVISVAATITGTARQAIVPRLVSRELLPAASALGGVSMGVMVTVGPALAGVLVASVGFGWTYLIDVVLFTAAFLGIVTLPAIRPEGETSRPGIESVKTGLRFLKSAPNVRMSFIVDVIAMTFGRPHALFPAVGALVIGGGAVTVGVLTAASAIGTLVCSLFSGRIGLVRKHGVAIGWSIAVYGAFVAGFGAVLAVLAFSGSTRSTSDIEGADLVALGIAGLMMAGTGAADNVSSIFRSTILQTAVPDNMRGRLQGIFTVVVTGGPRVGDFYVGVLALVVAVWVPPLLGGILIIALIALCLRIAPSFRHYDADHPTP